MPLQLCRIKLCIPDFDLDRSQNRVGCVNNGVDSATGLFRRAIDESCLGIEIPTR
jgi:hypothetical protein